jgi:hypothetical protein
MLEHPPDPPPGLEECRVIDLAMGLDGDAVDDDLLREEPSLPRIENRNRRRAGKGRYVRYEYRPDSDDDCYNATPIGR